MSYYRHGPYRPGPSVTIGVPPLTPMMRYIMIVCGVVWGVQFLSALIGFPPPRELLVSGVRIKQTFLEGYLGLVPRDVIRGFIWQPLTYMWLHAPRDIFHIGINMLVLWMFGGDLERFWGSRAFLRYYMVCGIGAAPFILVAGLLQGGGSASTIGASGAIFGLLLAFGMIFAERRVLFMLIFPIKARTMAIIMLAVAFVSTIGTSPSGVSHVAHLGGMVVGYLYLKRAWRLGEFFRELRWKIRRRSFRVIPPKDDDPWVN